MDDIYNRPILCNLQGGIMGCNCGSGRRNTVPRTRALRPTSGPRANPVSQGASPEQLRALNLSQNTAPSDAKNMDEQRRRIEKLRRQAIRRRFT